MIGLVRLKCFSLKVLWVFDCIVLFSGDVEKNFGFIY